MRCIHYLTQSCWTKQKNNSLHEMNFPTYDNPNINKLSQVKTVKNRAVWGALIVHNRQMMKDTKEMKYKADSRVPYEEERETKCHYNFIIILNGIV